MLKYLAIINSENTPVLLKNYHQYEESYIQAIIYSNIDILTLLYQMGDKSGQMGIIGQIDTDVIYGFTTMTHNKIIVIFETAENGVKEILRAIYEIYKQDLFNPFGENTQGLSRKIDDYINSLQPSHA